MPITEIGGMGRVEVNRSAIVAVLAIGCGANVSGAADDAGIDGAVAAPDGLVLQPDGLVIQPDGFVIEPDAQPDGLGIQPPAIRVPAGRNQIFVANMAAPTWSVLEPGGGTIDGAGMYVAPDVPGVYHVSATAGGVMATATVTVEQMYLTVLAGDLGGWGNIDGVGDNARFVGLQGVVAGAAGTLYVADYDAVRAIDVATHRVTTIAGGGTGADHDGIGEYARFERVFGLAFDDTTKTLYVSDQRVIRAIDVTTRTVTTIAGAYLSADTTSDGPGLDARFNATRGLCLVGGTLYIADAGKGTIRTLDTSAATHDVHRLAGQTGVAGFADSVDPLTATFSFPMGMACTQTTLYIADYGNSAIRTIDRTTGAVATLVGAPTTAFGDGPFATAGIPGPIFLTIDPAHAMLYASDLQHGVIRSLDLDAQIVSTLAGDPVTKGWQDGVGASARLFQPKGMATDGQTLWFADGTLYEMRAVELASATVTTIAGKTYFRAGGTTNGELAQARFYSPGTLATDGADHVFVGDSYTIRTISLATGMVSLRAGTPDAPGLVDGGPLDARLGLTYGLLVDPSGTLLESGDTQAIREIASDGTVTTDFGALGQRGDTDQIGTAARFRTPSGMAVVGNRIFVADLSNYTLRAIDRSSGMVTTFAGLRGVTGTTDGIGVAARFRGPFTIATDGVSKLWVGDLGSPYGGATIREVDIATGAVTTIAGDDAVYGVADGVGTAAHFTGPYALVYDGHGSLYIADTGLDQFSRPVALIRRMWVPSRAVTTYAGQRGKLGPALGPLQTGALAEYPIGLALTLSGDLLVTGEDAVFAIVRE